MPDTTVAAGGYRPVAQPEVQTPLRQDSGIRFRSGNMSVWSRILSRFRPATNHAPHQKFALRLPIKKHVFTNNLMGVRDNVFGDKENRRRTGGFRNTLNGLFRQAGKVSPRLKTDLVVEVKGGSRLSGFSVSANPNAPELDRDKPVVLFLSGSDGCAENYGARLAKHFAEDKGVNFVALNYRGYGNSTDVAPTEKTITRDGFAMMNHLLEQGFKPENIIVHGFSMGASVAARLQARVEASGHRLAGAVYDRPMSSATGAAKSIAEEETPNPQGFREKAYVFIKKHFYAFGTRITTGSMSARRSLERLQKANPDGLRSPTFVTYDTDTFGGRSRRMGEQLGVPAFATNGEHEDHESAVENAFSGAEIQAIYRHADSADNTQAQAAREPEPDPLTPLLETDETLLGNINKHLDTEPE